MTIEVRDEIASAPAGPARRARGRALMTGMCWALTLPGLAWAVVRGFGLERGPLVQLLAFTPYVAAFSPVPLVLAAALRRWRPAAVAAGCAVALLGMVAPRALTGGATDATGPTLRVLTANLLGGTAQPEALVTLVRDAHVDVLALQEFTPDAERALDRLGIADLLPYRQTNPEVYTPGSGLYSRFPLREGGTRRNDGGFTQAYATVLVPGAPPVRVESAHPMAPALLSSLPAWRTDLAAEPPATPDGPLRILAGDFNATLDHAPLRALLHTGYVDAADAAGAGLIGTWGPYDGDLIPPVVIDHVLVDRRIGVRAVSVHPLPGSDHRSVLAEVIVPGR